MCPFLHCKFLHFPFCFPEYSWISSGLASRKIDELIQLTAKLLQFTYFKITFTLPLKDKYPCTLADSEHTAAWMHSEIFHEAAISNLMTA